MNYLILSVKNKYLRQFKKMMKVNMFLLVFFMSFYSCGDKKHFINGKKLFKEEKYDEAIYQLKQVDIGSEYYDSSQKLIFYSDSLAVITIIEKTNEYLLNGNMLEAKASLDKITGVNKVSNRVNLLRIKVDSIILEMKNKEKKIQEKKNDSIKAAHERLRIEKDIQKLDSILTEIKNFKINETYREVDDLMYVVLKFNDWSKIIEKVTSNNSNKIINKLGKNVSDEQKKLQRRIFPKLRKEYARVLSDALWIEDIKAKVTGHNNTILQYIGGFFSINRNIDQAQNLNRLPQSALRFKEIQYKWNSIARTYTSYKLDSKDDGDVSPILVFY